MAKRVASRRPFAFSSSAIAAMIVDSSQERRERAQIAAPFGALLLEANAEFLIDIELIPRAEGVIAPASALLKETARQFGNYFDDPSWQFSLPLKIQGTAFQQKAWRSMAAIMLGSVKTYAQLARELGSGPRAVAGVCRANKFPIIIPCHRVVGSHGLGGYCGDSDGAYLDIKRWLLHHEGYDFPAA